MNKCGERGQPCLTPLWGWKDYLATRCRERSFQFCAKKVHTQLITDGPKPSKVSKKPKTNKKKKKQRVKYPKWMAIQVNQTLFRNL